MQFTKHQKGFLLIELLIAIAIIGLVFVGFMQLQSAFLKGKQENVLHTKAAYRAAEAFEAVRYVRKRDGWNAIASIPTGWGTGWRCPVIENGDWELVDIYTEPCVGLEYLDDSFVRVVAFTDVSRDGDSAIDNGTAWDSESRKVTVILVEGDDWTKMFSRPTFTFETILTSWEEI